MRKRIMLILLAPLAVRGQKDYIFLLKKYMQAHADIYEFSGRVLVAQNG